MSRLVTNKVVAALLGLAVGDALGVPVEFQRRDLLKQRPVTTMQGHGTHEQPAGTWSDDSSLTFCLAESLCRGYDLSDLANRIITWSDRGYWTAHGQVFDVGLATNAAIAKLRFGVVPTLAGGCAEADNGNGSLMRILPLVFHAHERPIADRFRLVREVSSLTHGHIRSVLACFIYTELARCLLTESDKAAAFAQMQQTVNDFVNACAVAPAEELMLFQPILANAALPSAGRALQAYHEADIQSSGYVLHTLEASLWCFLTTGSYAQAVLKAVNLGSDTDTTGCVTGGLAGLHYGLGGIPRLWLSVLARRTDIEKLASRLAERP